MIFKISNIKNLRNKINMSIRKPNMRIIQLSSLNKIWKKCMKKDKEENKKKWSMQEKFRDKKNKEEKKGILMLRTN